ncbi:hypothetical protein [Pandoraea sp. NPDC087047]|uniref:hypothetical protein n=1 Tax=Pandoraea sp. NPDC087047 TaxID=3364390 RepID=UPI0037FFE5AD
MTVAMAQTRAGMGIPSESVSDMRAAKDQTIAHRSRAGMPRCGWARGKASSCPKSRSDDEGPRKALCLQGFVFLESVLSDEINISSDKTNDLSASAAFECANAYAQKRAMRTFPSG